MHWVSAVRRRFGLILVSLQPNESYFLCYFMMKNLQQLTNVVFLVKKHVDISSKRIRSSAKRPWHLIGAWKGWKRFVSWDSVQELALFKKPTAAAQVSWLMMSLSLFLALCLSQVLYMAVRWSSPLRWTQCWARTSPSAAGWRWTRISAWPRALGRGSCPPAGWPWLYITPCLASPFRLNTNDAYPSAHRPCTTPPLCWKTWDSRTSAFIPAKWPHFHWVTRRPPRPSAC